MRLWGRYPCRLRVVEASSGASLSAAAAKAVYESSILRNSKPRGEGLRRSATGWIGSCSILHTS